MREWVSDIPASNPLFTLGAVSFIYSRCAFIDQEEASDNEDDVVIDEKSDKDQ